MLIHVAVERDRFSWVNWHKSSLHAKLRHNAVDDEFNSSNTASCGLTSVIIQCWPGEQAIFVERAFITGIMIIAQFLAASEYRGSRYDA